MKILVCSPCYKVGKLCEAVEMIPEFTLPVSRKKLPEQGLCSEHLTNMLEELIFGSDYTQKSVKVKNKKEKKKVKGELWDLVMKVSRKYHLPIAHIHSKFKEDNKNFIKGKNKTIIHKTKIAWLKKVASGAKSISLK